MIVSLSGKITHIFNDSVILEVNNIGYHIFLTPSFLAKIKKGDKITIFTHHHIRETVSELYGLEKIEDLKLFWKLINVTGVGPKMALRILELGNKKIIDAISKGKIALLSSISGVGRKTAQKIVLELKGILVETKKEEKKADEVVDALIKLGYSRKEALGAVENLPPELEKTEERLKAALRSLGKQ